MRRAQRKLAMMSPDVRAASGCTVAGHETGRPGARRSLAVHNSHLRVDWVLGIFCGGA